MALISAFSPRLGGGAPAARQRRGAKLLGFVAMIGAGLAVYFGLRALPWGALEADRFGKLALQTLAMLAAFAVALRAARWVGFPSFVEPWDAFFSRERAFALLALIVLYKVGDAFAGSLSTTFLIRGVGFTQTEVGAVNKVLGLAATIVGALAGGAWLAKRPLWGALMVFGLLQAVSNFGYWLLAVVAQELSADGGGDRRREPVRRTGHRGLRRLPDGADRPPLLGRAVRAALGAVGGGAGLRRARLGGDGGGVRLADLLHVDGGGRDAGLVAPVVASQDNHGVGRQPGRRHPRDRCASRRDHRRSRTSRQGRTGDPLMNDIARTGALAPEEITQEKLEAFWMPFTSNRQFKSQPRLLARAEGMHYYTPEGRQILDGTAGLWCVNAGHCRKPIVDAIAQAAGSLDFAPTFQMGHPLAFELSSRLVQLAGTAVQPRVLLQLRVRGGRLRAEDRARLPPGARRGRSARASSAASAAITAWASAASRWAAWRPTARCSARCCPASITLQQTWNLKETAFSRGQPAWGAHLADELERVIALHDPSTIAAVIVEPVAGSAGVLVPPKGYLEKLRAITEKHGILLIFDEVITGFGRLGKPFGWQYFGVAPDLYTTAKGINSGTVPMGAVFARSGIYEAFMQGPASAIEFAHGYTYSAHPLACAAALATLDVYADEGLLERVGELASHWEDALHSLKGVRNVIDVRNIGLMGAVELAPRDGAVGARGFDAHCKAFFEEDLLVRFTGDILAMSPPLIVEHQPDRRNRRTAAPGAGAGGVAGARSDGRGPPGPRAGADGGARGRRGRGTRTGGRGGPMRARASRPGDPRGRHLARLKASSPSRLHNPGMHTLLTDFE